MKQLTMQVEGSPAAPLTAATTVAAPLSSTWLTEPTVDGLLAPLLLLMVLLHSVVPTVSSELVVAAATAALPSCTEVPLLAAPGMERMLLEATGVETPVPLELANVCRLELGRATSAGGDTVMLPVGIAGLSSAKSLFGGVAGAVSALSAASAMQVGDSGGRPQMVSSSLRSARYSRGCITAKHRSSSSDCSPIHQHITQALETAGAPRSCGHL